jgi:hypothetical protein
MKATGPWLGTLLIAAGLASLVRADHCNPCVAPPPNAFTPSGCCCPCYWGGPGYWPPYGMQPFQPFNGFRPSLGVPVHPFARSPRDYFMMDDP